MDKKSGLLQIIEYGTDNQKDTALDVLKPILIDQGDFQTASMLITKYPNLFKNSNGSKQFMKQVSNSFLTTLQYDNSREATDSLVEYMYNEHTPSKDVAKDQFRLFSILGLYQTMMKYLVNSGSFERMPEFKEITYMYDAMHTIQTIKGGSYHAFSSLPQELRSAIGVSAYLSKLLDKNRLDTNTSDISDVNVIKDTKIEFWKAREHFDSARNGYHTTLEDNLENAKNSPSEIKFINALMPCAVVNQLIREYDDDLLCDYKGQTAFEKESPVFAAIEKLAPILTLEKLRQTLNSGKELTNDESERLFKIEKKIDAQYKPFAYMVKETHMAKL
jgi:hypothetical protein